MDTISIVSKELSIPEKYMKKTSRNDRVLAVVHRFWLKSLLRNHSLSDFIFHDTLNTDEVEVSLYQAEDLGPWWQKLFIRVFEKRFEYVFPLPHAKTKAVKSETAFSYSQLLSYISQTNRKNLWKDIFQKHLSMYTESFAPENDNKNAEVSDLEHNLVMHDIISRVYGCPIIQLRGENSEANVASKKIRPCEVHSNILPALCAVETEDYFLLIQQPAICHSLQDCITFSPAMLSTSHLKPLFIIYQILHAMKCLHDRGLVIGDITLHDILVTDNLWIKIIPQLVCNIHFKAKDKKVAFSQERRGKVRDQTHAYGEAFQRKCTNCGSTPMKPSTSKTEDISVGMLDTDICDKCGTRLESAPILKKTERLEMEDTTINDLQCLCQMWVKGRISNFTYLMALNRLAGRRYGDPTCHYVMPWVTNFLSRSGGTWRDFTRSKFRLNKGDRQLDLTYNSAVSSQVPHHVSDVLSEITYYVYMARRTPRSVLCNYVRTKWVPAEYPSSIQRLQEWTPDECIPEFFSDASVFESIHDDLPDLETPPWASSAEDFIEKHREALESQYVSERLHHWIDLTFGYKLSGSAAIKSKNVCLQLVDNHASLRNTGVVQLFTQPHPQRNIFSPFWGITAPRLHPLRKGKRKIGEHGAEDEGQSSCFEDEDSQAAQQNLSRSSPLALNRLLSRSRGSLLQPFSSSDDRDRTDAPKPSTSVASSGTSTIVLPRDYNPMAALQNVEALHGFLGKTFYSRASGDSKPSKAGRKEVSGQSSLHHRSNDMKVFGCLVVELLMAPKLRAFGSQVSLSFEDRMRACIAVLSGASDSIPRYVKYAVSLLLQVDCHSGESKASGSSSRSTDQGLPPPSAHQLLQPLLSSAVFPFPRYFSGIYTLLQKFHDYTGITRELEFLHSVDRDGCKDTNSDVCAKIGLFASKVGELKVKAVCDELAALLPDFLNFSSSESLDLIMPYIKELLEDRNAAVSTAWCLFDPIAKALGPQKSTAILLDPILKLYEYGAEDQSISSGGTNKHVKLYHRSFLLQLIVRLGLKTFLENFVTPLVEAVGGYRDISSADSGLSQQQGQFRNKTSNLRTCDLEEAGPIGTLSPLDEDSSGDSENKPSNGGDDEEGKKSLEQVQDVELEPEVFVLETEELGRQSPPGDAEVPLYNLMEHLNLNLPQPSTDGDDNVLLELADQHDEGAGASADEEAVDTEGEDASSDVDKEKDPESSPVLASEPGPSNEGQVGEGIPKLIEEDIATKDQRDEKTRKAMGHYKVSDMSADSLLWLSHRLGPVLTSRHLSRNLLRMLTLCYLGRDSLSPLQPDSPLQTLDRSNVLSIANGTVVGDKNALKVLECLTSIAGLYGEQLIVLQYLPHMGELITLCKRKLTANLEGGLVGCLALLKHIIPYLSDATLMDQLQDVILKNILNPAVRLVSTTRFTFPSGQLARAAVAAKFVDAVYILSLRIGCEMTRKNLAVPSLQRFFLAFDKAHGRKKTEEAGYVPRSLEGRKEAPAGVSKSLEDSSFVEVRRDGSTTEWAVKGMPLQISHVRLRDSDSADSFSPPLSLGPEGDCLQDQTRSEALDELKCTFTPELAHKSYVSFLRFLGETVMEQSLKNEEFIKTLCFEYEQQRQQCSASGDQVNLQYLSDYLTTNTQSDADRGASGSFGSNVSVVGNRIDLQRVDVPSVLPPASSAEDVMALISRKMENTKRHLRGNWLAYWEHEIGRAEKDTRFNFKQIKLQTFSGHTNNIRMIQALDNENSFLSGSRDKTVKLWSLRSEGDGSAVSHCQWTYTGHRKSVMAISFLESLRLAASCDSIVHLWDPFIGCVVGILDSAKSPPVNVLKAMPPPSTCLLASTTDATLRIIDGRTCSFVNELKVSMNPSGLIRCIGVGPEGHWVAVGQSSGILTILDIRTGMIMSSWKAHEGDVLQLVAINSNTVISSALDQTVSVWKIQDGKLSFQMKGPNEPVHCLNCYNSELISGTTASRIGVHTAIDPEASFSSTRLRSDTFKGVLTAMAVLPLNKLLLLGADNGNISLLC